MIDPDRPALLVYNSVERLLRGDYFHCVTIEKIRDDLSEYNAKSPLIGVGTSNWYDRNGELVIDGTAHYPRFIWADPKSESARAGSPGKLVNLERQLPDHPERLITPEVGKDDIHPEFPFAAFAVCNNDRKMEWDIPEGTNVTEFVTKRCEEENVGMAAISLTGMFSDIEYADAFHLPLGGLDLSNGYTAEDAFKFGKSENKRWELRGIYTLNVTLQHLVSVEGHPLHLHGYSEDEDIGGHINVATTSIESKVTVWPLVDLIMKIADLDKAWMPVKDLP